MVSLIVGDSDAGCVYTGDRELTFIASTIPEDLLTTDSAFALQWFLDKDAMFHFMLHYDWFNSFSGHDMLGLVHLQDVIAHAIA